ncbi:MAG: UbiA family prenyltransferase [Desulfobacterales bacterium]
MSQLARPYTGFHKLKLFLALSRTPHGLLDMATPALGALLWLGRFPAFEVILLGLFTTFAGYTAVYALNDVIDYRVDKEKLKLCGNIDIECDLDAAMVRHPMAQGYLSFIEGMLWTVAWSILAVWGAYHLNPVCILIFAMGCLLEAIYCLLLKVTHFRTLVSGGVKTAGAIAGVFAVDPKPSPLFLFMLFLWLFLWEIGGQNVPNDWTDIEVDQRLHARTIPVQLGPDSANTIIIGSLTASAILCVFVFLGSPIPFEFPFLFAAASTGLFFLILPAVLLYKTRKPRYAMALFNMASTYPLVLLVIVVTNILAG